VKEDAVKTLLTVTIWGAFIAAWWKILTVFIFQGLIGGYSFLTNEVAPWEYYAGSLTAAALAGVGGFLIWVRKKIE
jgi:hypothetical protein